MKRIIINGFLGEDFDKNVTVTPNKDEPYMADVFADIIADRLVGEFQLSTEGEGDCEMGVHSFYVPNCNVSFYISDDKISLKEVSERYTMQLLGGLDVFSENYGYSSWTIMGYEVEKFMIGNHDLTKILSGYNGKYINFIMEY